MRRNVVCGNNFRGLDHIGRKIYDILPRRRSQASKPRILRLPTDALTRRIIKEAHGQAIWALPKRNQFSEVMSAIMEKKSLAEEERVQERSNTNKNAYISKRNNWEEQLLKKIHNSLKRRNLITFPIIAALILISYFTFDMGANTSFPFITLLLTLVILVPVMATNRQLCQHMYIDEYHSMLAELSDDERTLEYDFIRVKDDKP